MKTCSKCKQELPETSFVKSPRYLCGLHPHCNQCRKEYRDRRLAQNPLCIRCQSEPHIKSNPYCRACIRIVNGLPVERQRPNVDRNNKTLCCGCKVKPRRKGGHYCQECANAMNREWSRANRREYILKPGNREKINARSFVNWKLSKGELQRGPCAVCGTPDTQAHHHKGYSNEHRLDVIWLCVDHHVEAHRATK